MRPRAKFSNLKKPLIRFNKRRVRDVPLGWKGVPAKSRKTDHENNILVIPASSFNLVAKLKRKRSAQLEETRKVDSQGKTKSSVKELRPLSVPRGEGAELECRQNTNSKPTRLPGKEKKVSNKNKWY